MMGEHEFIPKETALYTENPFSESHILGKATLTLAATLGLLRVFASEEFVEFASKIALADRGVFVATLEEAIRQRIPNVQYADLIWTMSIEQLNNAWGYQEPNSTAATKDVFSVLGESYTPDILNGILSKLEAPNEYKSKKTNGVNPFASLAKETEAPGSSENKKKRKWNLLSALYQGVGRLPYFIRKRIFQLYNFFKSMANRHPKDTF
jgi:hypothetical protein